jgi:hypothetical protein
MNRSQRLLAVLASIVLVGLIVLARHYFLPTDLLGTQP